MCYIGKVYLFGLFCVYDGLYAANLAETRGWKYRLRPWVRPFVVLKWTRKGPNVGTKARPR
jgi:hypothetical protein